MASLREAFLFPLLLQVTANECRGLWRGLRRRPTIPLDETLELAAPQASSLLRQIMELPRRDQAVLYLHYLLVAYVEIEDLEGGRLREEMDVWGRFEQIAPERLQVSMTMLGGDIIRLGEDGKTALAAVMEWGGQSAGDPNMTLELSWVGIHAVTQRKENAAFENTRDQDKLRGELTVYFSDGSRRVSVRNSLAGSFDLGIGSWLFMVPCNLVQPEDVEPLDVEHITGISCQDRYIPIEDGAAGPIRWTQP